MSMGRGPREDLKGLLWFSLEHTKAEVTKESACQEMDEEKRKFLESALNCMTTDVMKDFQIAISILEDDSSDVSDKINALNTIRENIDDIDFANSFVKAGGSVYLIKFLTHQQWEIKSLASYIIAEISQNNPFCQKYFTDSKTIPILINNLRESPVVAHSSLHAISSLIDNFELGLQEFLNADGINALLCCLCQSDSKLLLRACFLIGKLGQREDLRDDMVEKLAIVQLVRCLPLTLDKYDINVETALYALCELLKSEKWKIDNDQSEKLETLTGGIVRNKLAYPENDEIYEYACEILQRINDHLAKIKQH